MKSKIITLICYTCGREFGKAAFSGIENMGAVTKLRWLMHNDRDSSYDIKFFCCENCADRREKEGTVHV